MILEQHALPMTLAKVPSDGLAQSITIPVAGRGKGNSNERPSSGAKWKAKSQVKQKGQRPLIQKGQPESAGNRKAVDSLPEDTAETQGMLLIPTTSSPQFETIQAFKKAE